MAKITIVGSGDVGATLAYTLQVYGLATEILLIDANATRAEGNAMDMNDGLPFTAPVRIYAGSYPECTDSDLFVITSGARSKPDETRLQLTERNAGIVKEIVRKISPYVTNAKILVLTNPVDVMTCIAARTSGLPSHRVFGSGTVLDSARFRYELSKKCGVDPRNVHAYVIGEHGDSEVFLWSQIHMGGIPFDQFCPLCGRSCTPDERLIVEKNVRESAYHIIEAKGYTNYGVSLAALKIITAVLRNERSILTLSTVMEGAFGLHNICVSVPCVVGSNGVERVLETPLSAEEMKGFIKSAETVRSYLLGLETRQTSPS